MTEIRELLIRYYKENIVNVFCLIGLSILSIWAPLLLKEAIDYDQNLGYDKNKVITYIIVLTVYYFLKFGYQRFKFWFAENFKNKETKKLYQKIFHMKYEKINAMEPSYIMERVQGTIDTIFNLYCSSISGIFVSGLTMVLILGVVAKINIALAVLYALQIPLQYFGFQRLLNGEKSKLSKYGEKIQKTRAKNNKNIKAIISDVDSIKQ